MQKIIFIGLIGLIIIFGYQYKFGTGGERDNKSIQKQIAEQQKTKEELEARNKAITMKIIGLKGSTDFLEARSRQELNLVKPNEILVLLPGHSVTKKP